MKFRKKPVVIDAVQFTGPKGKVVNASDSFEGFAVKEDARGVFLTIPTLEGDHRCESGDWIVTGVKGEKYPCKPDVFVRTYEPA